MRQLHAQPEVGAVGELGLDYFRDFSPRPAQRRAFERQLQIAADLAAAGTPKPLFLHQRDAHADFLAVMREFDGRHGPVVVHCRSEEHTSELQSLMRISYAVFCLKKKKSY